MKQAEFEKLSDKERMNRVLEGTMYFGFIHKPRYSEKYKYYEYMLTLGLDAANQARAESFGLEVQEPTDRIPEPHIVIGRKVRPGKTAEQCRPEIVDSLQNAVPSSIIPGNGSKVAVRFGTYWFDKVRTTLFKVQILELVPFVPKSAPLTSTEGTFVVPATAEESPFDDDGFVDQTGT